MFSDHYGRKQQEINHREKIRKWRIKNILLSDEWVNHGHEWKRKHRGPKFLRCHERSKWETMTTMQAYLKKKNLQ